MYCGATKLLECLLGSLISIHSHRNQDVNAFAFKITYKILANEFAIHLILSSLFSFASAKFSSGVSSFKSGSWGIRLARDVQSYNMITIEDTPFAHLIILKKIGKTSKREWVVHLEVKDRF